MQDDGYIRQITPDAPIRQREAAIPSEDVEKVVNATRAERRRWYRAAKKAERRAALAEPPVR